MKTFAGLFLIAITFLFFFSCQQEANEENNNAAIQGDGIQVSDAWARPGAEGRMSAAYFLVSNFNMEDDKLLSVDTDIARTAEVHESYEREEGMMGMREVPQLDLPAQSTVRFEQGGLHVMLMDLTQQLSDGDMFKLTLAFEKADSVTVDVPVRL